MSPGHGRTPLMVRALKGEDTPRVPVWLMRQAGRYLPEYRAMRERHSFLELTRTPELSAQVTLQPVERFDLDAAIVFYDILYVLEALGADVSFSDSGPKVDSPLAGGDGRLPDLPEEPDMEPFSDLARALSIVRSELDRDKALIGFVGGPFTLLTYLAPGTGEAALAWTRRMLMGAPDAARSLLDRLSRAAAGLAGLQVEAGAQVIQVFDTWAGTLPRELFEHFAAPAASLVAAAAARAGAETIYFARGSGHLLQAMSDMPFTGFSVDWTVDLAWAAGVLGPSRAVQGNLDPAALLCEPHVVESETRLVLSRAAGIGAYVFNLGHGVLPDTPLDSVERLVAAVRTWKEGA